VHIYVHMYIYIYVYIHLYTHTAEIQRISKMALNSAHENNFIDSSHKYIRSYIHTYTYVYIYIYSYVCIYIYIYVQWKLRECQKWPQILSVRIIL
jgi:hypothetical protein